MKYPLPEAGCLVLMKMEVEHGQVIAIPGLITKVFEDGFVEVIPGKKVPRNGIAHKEWYGVLYRFYRENKVAVPYDDANFTVPVAPEFGRNPKIGQLSIHFVKRILG